MIMIGGYAVADSRTARAAAPTRANPTVGRHHLPRHERYRMLLRSATTTAHARRSLIPSAVRRCATASRCAADVTIFLTAGPSDPRCRASCPPTAAGAGYSPFQALAAALHRIPPGRRTWPSTRNRSRSTYRAPAQIRHHRARFGLLQDADDLRLRNCFRSICPSLLRGRTLASTGGQNRSYVSAREGGDRELWGKAQKNRLGLS